MGMRSMNWFRGLASVCVLFSTTSQADATLVQENVFVSGEDEYHTYRIPSLVVTPEGSLLAICEGRKDGSGDSGNIDIVFKRSDDGGRTWSPLQKIWDDGSNTCGNPCSVVDKTTGVIWLLLTHNLGADNERTIVNGKSRQTRTVWFSQSKDDGVTWSAPIEITSDVKAPDWTWYATGPGVGIQLQQGAWKGRLVIPCDHIEAESKKYYSHVIYSDDHGATWQLGGSTPRDQVNECEVVELSDSRLMLNMRSYDRSRKCRQIAYSDDGGKTWRDQQYDETLIDPICQASIQRASWPSDGKPGLLLFSNAASRTKRINMTVRGSLDDGDHWPVAKRIYAGPSAYSSLATLPDGSLGCFYEADGYRRIVLARFTRDWLFGTERTDIGK